MCRPVTRWLSLFVLSLNGCWFKTKNNPDTWHMTMKSNMINYCRLIFHSKHYILAYTLKYKKLEILKIINLKRLIYGTLCFI